MASTHSDTEVEGLSDIAVAAVLAGTVLLASTISVEIGISVALIELAAGFLVGNALPPVAPAHIHLEAEG
jgi:hypothetical protein